MVDDNGKAKKRVITCGDFTAEGVTVVEGLHQGDRIIVEGATLAFGIIKIRRRNF